MTQYFIRALDKVRNRFEVAKYDGEHDVPMDTYITILSQDTCTCPSYKMPCKHIDLVKRWLKLDEPHKYYYDDVTLNFNEHPFTGAEMHITRRKSTCPTS